ncbi:uncharacterized protein LOC134794077 isoform X1 [Cydia splendana]|uniref:uncharacterized protein LOC134794077 isoform X1 n=1 Tax=Cydia splendana TaxID=1100963 RepID=UPI002131332D
MADSQFCLEWDSHNKNICNGLSALQQNGEFVDMTLAADGHHVKVHQMVMALASPYIKELISTANCPHPVIFLNKVSYKTLCSILEYIYTGQALVAVDDISDLIIAAKELHIKGLEDVKAAGGAPSVTEVEVDFEAPKEVPEIQIKLQRPDTSTPQFSALNTLKRKLESNKSLSSMPIRKRVLLNKSETENRDMPVLQKDGKEKEVDYDDPLDGDDRDDYDDDGDHDQDTTVAVSKPSADNPQKTETTMNYSVSKNGVLRLILNRFVYSAEYRYSDGRRKWRCSNRNLNCKAFVVTKDNLVVRRMFNHIHAFHDRKILKMVAAGNVLAALPEDCIKDANQSTLSKKPCEQEKKINFAERPLKKIKAKKPKGQGDRSDGFERASEHFKQGLDEKPCKKSTKTKKPYGCKQSAEAQIPFEQGNQSVDSKRPFKQRKKFAEPEPFEQGNHSSAAKIPCDQGSVPKLPCSLEERAVAERLCELKSAGQRDSNLKVVEKQDSGLSMPVLSPGGDRLYRDRIAKW